MRVKWRERLACEDSAVALPGLIAFASEWPTCRAACAALAIPALSRRSSCFPALPYFPPR
jgi:hypothetical protein